MPPAVVLPDQKRQPRRLLDIATPLPPVEGQGSSNRWLEGVTWNPSDCSTLTVDADPELCDDDTFSETWTIGCETWLTALPFRIQQKFIQTVLNFPDEKYAQMRLQENYERMVSAAFAARLAFLLSEAAVEPDQGQAFADAALPIASAIAVLESTIADRLHGGLGFIHVPPLLLGSAVNTAGLRFVNDHYETAIGNVIVSDAGYNHIGAPADQAAPADMNDWVYASGEIFWKSTVPVLLDPVFHDDSEVDSETPWQRNRYEQWINGYGILVFDTCGVTAAQASLSA